MWFLKSLTGFLKAFEEIRWMVWWSVWVWMSECARDSGRLWSKENATLLSGFI